MRSIFILVIMLSLTKSIYANDINKQLVNAMTIYKVPVVSYAIIDNNKVVSVNTISIKPKIKVDSGSLFQAASISKSVTTLGFLQLVELGQIKLDKPANDN